VYRRNDPNNLKDVLNKLDERVRKLEDTASRRVLPAGYTFAVNTNGDLVVIRDADGQTEVIISA